MNWNGEERRGMSRDSVERDRLLTEVATNVRFLVDGHKNTIQALVDHARNDDTRFGHIDTSINKINVGNAWFYGKIYGGSAVIAAISALVTKALTKS